MSKIQDRGKYQSIYLFYFFIFNNISKDRFS